VAAFIGLPESAVRLGLTILAVWTVASFLLAILVGHALRVLSDAG